MKIVVLNGSPKGELSVTMQYIQFVQKKFPQHQFKILNVAFEILRLEKNENYFKEMITEVKTSDGIIWAFPLYFMLVCSQYKRFIELIFERNVKDAFYKKFAAIVATSIKFFDHTAIEYIRSICDDLDMIFIDSYSAKMDDLFNKECQNQLISFANNFILSVEKKLISAKQYSPLIHRAFEYKTSDSLSQKRSISTNQKKVLIVTDSTNQDSNIWKMINTVQNCFSGPIEVINLYDIDIKGGCLGCIRCGYDNQCAYDHKDGFRDFWNNKMITADVLIFAGTIKDRYLSSRWKMVFDRSFFNGHVPTITGKQIGFLISGPISQIANLKQIFTAFVEIQESNLVDIVSDEFGDSKDIDLLLYNFAEKLIRFSNSTYKTPPTFLAIGGVKIFRDNVYESLRGVFQADHRYYKKYGYYDFPKKIFGSRLLKLAFKMKGFRKVMYKNNRLQHEMIKPLKKLVQKA